MASDNHRHKRVKHEDAKPKKELCRICYTEIEAAYLTPCLSCRKPYCDECIKQQFELALKDKEMMPPKCCGRVFYHRIAQGILSAKDLELYKQRYDESVTANPFYCPTSTCSAFIPPRNLKPVRGKVTCNLCNTVSCGKCRQIAGPGEHICADSTEADDFVKRFGYKRCPKCNAAVSRMYGCAHIRCNHCGAHFCWDCLRPINICNVKPCIRARDDGDMSEPDDGDPLSDDDGEESLQILPSNTGQARGIESATLSEQDLSLQDGHHMQTSDQSAVSGTTPTQVQEIESALTTAPDTSTVSGNGTVLDPQRSAAHIMVELATTPTTRDPATSRLVQSAGTEPISTSAAVPEIANLDDPGRDDIDWEAEFNFGEEPTEETWDIWGCLHRFNILTMASIPDKWLLDLDKSKIVEVDCMGCFKKIKLNPTANTDSYKGQENMVRATESSQVQEGSNAVISNDGGKREQGSHLSDVRKKTKEDKKKAVYDCADCGVIYCWWCRRLALRQAEKFRQEIGSKSA